MAEVIGGRYEIEGVLGTGAMGVVYRAHDTVLDRTVALKELTAPAGMDPDEAVERFLTEARAGARLRHPAIVIVHDVLAEGDRVLMAMELLEGPTLSEALEAAGGGLGPDVVRAIMGQVAGALAEAHSAGVVHRDLKPENIFWLPSGRVVVCDFGLARIGAGSGTRVGTVMGTLGYLAPEQVRGHRAGPTADIFSWGAVAYELLSGAPAFGDATAEDPATLIWRVVNEDPAPLRLPDDPGLGELVAWTLAKDPDERPADGIALIEALGGEVAIPTVSPSGARSLPPRASVGARSGRSSSSVVGAALAAVLVVLAVIVGVVLIGGGGDEKVVVGGANQGSDDFKANQLVPTSVTADVTALKVQSLLDQSRPARALVVDSVEKVGACALSPADGSRALDSAMTIRQHLLDEMTSIDFETLPGGARLRGQLREALTASLEAGRAFQGWMRHVSVVGCETAASQDGNWSAASDASDRASAAKRGFVTDWNPVAAGFGLRAWQAQDI